MAVLLKPASETSILVVDDAPANLRLLAKILEAQQYIVLKSLNGRMALQVARHNPPDLILLDINMPELNGYEVCQQLKASELTSNIPVIFISALDQVHDKVRAFELGGQDYITKPFQELEVLARITNQLLIQQQKRQLQQEIQVRQQVEAEVRRLNTDLERQVQARTLELQQSLSFELALKHISDQVRDSLDQHQILQAAVETLAVALEARCCGTALYGGNHGSSIIQYQWTRPDSQADQAQTLSRSDVPALYEQLQARICFSFCPTRLNSVGNHAAILVCPIFDDQVNEIGVLGDLWLLRDACSSFNEMEIHLVHQVSNQCAIALRQAKLYEAAQAQVKELERLNQLKDDFLNTISHELRTPIASMKTILRLLATLTERGCDLADEISKSARESKVAQYFEVLQEECDRELALVDDLLNLQYIQAGLYSSQPTLINLQDLLPHLIEPFEARARNQQQVLKIDLAPNLPSFNLDPLVINRIITELLSNACKYTPAGETISIAANIIQTNTDSEPIQYLKVEIVNTGVEIPAEELPCVFDKFYRIPNHDPWRYEGTGLGLALVKKLVEQIDGSIHVDSQDNKTCFTLKIAVVNKT